MDSLDLIKTFREVAQRGSFSAAARTLDVSKANVSKYVAELETRFGVRLFNRTTRNVSLTDAGRLLLARSGPLVDMVELTRDELLQRTREPSGRLRLSAPHGLAHIGLPELLAEFMARHPAVSISLHLSNRVVDLVDEGIDIALRVTRITDTNLIVRRLRQVNYAVAATPAYWDRHGRPTHPEELAEHEALTYSLLGATPEWRFEVDGEPLSVPVHSRLDASEAAPLVRVALQGLGVVWLPRLLVQAHLDSDALESVLDDYSPRDVWLHAAYAQRRHNSAALKALLQFLEQHWGTGGGARPGA